MILSLLLLGSAVPALAQMGGGDGGMGGMGGGGMGGGGRQGGRGEGRGEGGGMGGARGPEAPKPIKRERFDKIVAAMFREADTNRDGLVTIAELNALIEGRRDAAIRARFARVDGNRDGVISQDEFAAWQKQMGSAALQEGSATGNRGEIIPDSIMPDPGDKAEDAMLAALIAPLNATVIAQANTNYDAGLSLDELIAFEGKRFVAADTNGDGWLTMDELRPRRQGGGQGSGPAGGGAPGPAGMGRGMPPG
ncbi:EF-hand domain-containing protein [Novosphingobium flavum]|uniref:EF-hand domain-containing protein n=1 Tax=Novosphingobium flavum TaxID=1778672 RepID=UPI0031B599AF